MSQQEPTCEELKTRLAEAEDIIKALRGLEVDAVLGNGQVAFLRTRELEEALLVSEAFNREVLDSLESPIVILDEAGTIIAVNKAWKRFARENGAVELARASVGMNYVDVTQGGCGPWPDQAPAAVMGIEEVLSNPNATFTLEYPCHSPEQERWFLLHVTRLTGTKGRAVLLHVDITQRKKAENELRQHRDELETLVQTRTGELKESEARYRRLVEGSPGTLYLFSSRKGGVFYSSRAEIMLGYPVTHLLKDPFLWNQSIHPDDLPRVTETIQDAIPHGGFDIEYRIKNARGEWRWLRGCSVDVRSEDGEIRIEGLATDITQYKRAEELLRESHEKLGMIAEQSIDGIWQSDSDGTLFFISAAAERIFGYTPGATTGTNLQAFFPETEGVKLAKALDRVRSGEAYHLLELTGLKKDGSLVPLEFSAAPIQQDGLTIGV